MRILRPILTLFLGLSIFLCADEHPNESESPFIVITNVIPIRRNSVSPDAPKLLQEKLKNLFLNRGCRIVSKKAVDDFLYSNFIDPNSPIPWKYYRLLADELKLSALIAVHLTRCECTASEGFISGTLFIISPLGEIIDQISISDIITLPLDEKLPLLHTINSSIANLQIPQIPTAVK